MVQPSIQQKHSIGHKWPALLDKYFPKDHKLRKIFNCNTIKTSYSFMNHTKQIINNHNQRILNSLKHINDTAGDAKIKDNKTCNCRQKNTSPLNRDYLQPSVIYQATVTGKDNSTTDKYIGIKENDFSIRYRNHTASFRRAKQRNSIELSKHIRTVTLTTLLHGVSFHQDHPAIAQAKDATST